MHRSLRSSSMRHGKPRRQDRNSPAYLLDAGRQVAGGRFDLDPASNSRALVDAKHECWYGGRNGAAPKLILKHCSRGRVRWRGDGLEVFWEDFLKTFGNPPWGNCGAFLKRAYEAATFHRRGSLDWSIQLLTPLRPHRVYWKWAYTADAWCLLKPVAYEGFEHQMPTPCVWLYWGSDVARFREVFHGFLGVVLTRFPPMANLYDMPRKPDPGYELMDFAQGALLEHFIRKSTVDELAAAMRMALSELTMYEVSRLPEDLPLWVSFEYKQYSKVAEATEILLKSATVKSMSKTVSAKKPKKKTKKKVATRKRSKKKTTKRVLATTKKATSRTKAVKKAPKKKAKKKAPTNGVSKSLKTKAPKKERKNGGGKPEILDMAIEAEILRGRTQTVSCIEVAKAMKVSRSTALRALNRLRDAKKVSEVGDGRRKAYQSKVGVPAPEATA